ncbi:MAG TPA: HAMP domain-containing sensor histidine kinase [Nitrososphaeraceae archaeon]|nr:HAMP domain-containing sensor histidine kinase [Nitrososphaeraceae archaeon]
MENTNAMQREFINTAAHELKTPIQPILGYAELLLEEESDDKKRHALMGIVRNSERLQQLASDVLDVAKMESKTFQQQLGERIKQGQQEQEQKQQYAIITIKDTGTGIHSEILPRLFSKFATKSHRGTGLGLYISRNIIGAHGGKLYATNNTDGKCRSFTIILPLVKVKE